MEQEELRTTVINELDVTKELILQDIDTSGLMPNNTGYISFDDLVYQFAGTPHATERGSDLATRRKDSTIYTGFTQVRGQDGDNLSVMS